jgi:hypothetical protein
VVGGVRGIAGYLPERVRWGLPAKCVHDGGGLALRFQGLSDVLWRFVFCSYKGHLNWV